MKTEEIKTVYRFWDKRVAHIHNKSNRTIYVKINKNGKPVLTNDREKGFWLEPNDFLKIDKGV